IVVGAASLPRRHAPRNGDMTRWLGRGAASMTLACPSVVARLVSRIREARYVGFGWKYPIHAPNRGRVAPHVSLRSDTMFRTVHDRHRGVHGTRLNERIDHDQDRRI